MKYGEKEAQKRWRKIGRASQSIDSIDSAFPLLANRRLGQNDAQRNIADAVLALRSSRPDLVFTQGVLQLAAGQTEEGAALLQKSARAADPLVRYLSLVTLRDVGQSSASAAGIETR